MPLDVTSNVICGTSEARTFLTGANDEVDDAILIATFAKGIEDLGLDIVVIVEHQPRANEPDRFNQLVDRLNGDDGQPWASDQTAIEYDNPSHSFSNLQFGLIWDTTKVTIDPDADQLLSDLRQPRNSAGQLVSKRTRVPWLVPVKTNQLEFDIISLHLKSGGSSPQAEEVNALESFIRTRQIGNGVRHLVVSGDWNIRPDQTSGRGRLRQMMVPTSSGNQMRLLTVGQIPPTLDGWETFGSISSNEPVAGLIPFTHFNANSVDTFLDHIAISRTLDEIFDHPVRVTNVGGGTDLRPGIRIARPLIPESDFNRLTDHLPVVLTLRTTDGTGTGPTPAAGLRIVSAIPNPVGSDSENEQVTLRNFGAEPEPLADWKIRDATAQSAWNLTAQDGTVQPGQSLTIKRKGRPMSLNNRDGDTISLVNPSGETVDVKFYSDDAASGQVFAFP